MRRSGLVDQVRGLGAHDHLCWRYRDRREFRERAREFLADGLALGLQVWCVAPGAVADLVEDLRGTAALDEALRTGAARVASLEATYPVGAVVDPDAQVRAYAEATEAALRAGFGGLRVAADCTPLVRTPDQLAAVARYEHLVDHYMVDGPFSAMCAYSDAEVDDEAFAQLACMHPITNSPSPGFRLHAAGDRAVALGGELDMHDDALFTLALRRAWLRPRDGRLVIDARGLDFLDHRTLIHLSAHAADLGAPVVLRTAWEGVATLVDLLGLTNVHPERAA
ncbi:MEDS domain-containing protein [Saccharothrix syringae]|uniref:STAS domain-containing protein n=1 Tax=Saccharothrix syringae TaxID=103733 RepID=A0A5Q0H410_SACSY|nr:MEDS domain-containing protein [Saccharothrix syringae]QFZ20976.1 STAS domain-containing protein [Saccharothrix syringae]